MEGEPFPCPVDRIGLVGVDHEARLGAAPGVTLGHCRAAAEWSLRDDKRRVAVAHVQVGAFQVSGGGGLDEAVTAVDGAVLGTTPPGAPAAEVEAQVERDIKGGAIGTALAAGDDALRQGWAPRRDGPEP